MNKVFQDTQEILKDLRNRVNKNKCGKCGQEVNWTDKQFKRNCSKCGNVLTRTSALPQKPLNCWLCFDTGIITYQAQLDDYSYEFGAACTCELGKNFVSETIPLITQVFFAPPLATIERNNRELCKEKE
jgi:predicted RNA-binding Zn-ribbon protein involved in translation (DUF1610 family)